MATFARPDGDVTPGAWVTHLGGGSNLYAELDESSHSEADYVQLDLSDGPPGIPGQFSQTYGYTTPGGTAVSYWWVYAGVEDDAHVLLLMLPAGLDRGVATPGVLWHHGVTGNEQQTIQNLGSTSGAQALVDSWLDRGWWVASFRDGTTGVIDATHDNNDGKWANSATRAAFETILPWLDRVFTFPPAGLLMFGVSAGGLVAFNCAMTAHELEIPVAAIAMVDPCTNLRWAYNQNYETDVTSNSGGLDRTKIINAYDIQNHEGTARKPYVTEVEWTGPVDGTDNGHDPQQVTLTFLPACPVYVSASGSDGTVDKSKNADYLVARLTAAGWDPAGVTGPELKVVSYSGGHNASSHFLPSDTNAFFDRALA